MFCTCILLPPFAGNKSSLLKWKLYSNYTGFTISIQTIVLSAIAYTSPVEKSILDLFLHCSRTSEKCRQLTKLICSRMGYLTLLVGLEVSPKESTHPVDKVKVAT